MLQPARLGFSLALFSIVALLNFVQTRDDEHTENRDNVFEIIHLLLPQYIWAFCLNIYSLKA